MAELLLARKDSAARIHSFISLSVLDGYRNQGIGTQLIYSIELLADDLIIQVNKQNPALNLYERLGYTVKMENTPRTYILRKEESQMVRIYGEDFNGSNTGNEEGNGGLEP